jgi:hypothetical protein
MSDMASRPEETNDGIVTSWIPFTTPGPDPGSTCSSAIYQIPGSTTLLGFDNWFTSVDPGVTCLPTEVIESRASTLVVGTPFVAAQLPIDCCSE